MSTDGDTSTYLVFGDRVCGDFSIHHVSTFQPVSWRNTTDTRYWRILTPYTKEGVESLRILLYTIGGQAVNG